MASDLTIFLLVETVARHSHYVQKFTLKRHVIFYHLMNGCSYYCRVNSILLRYKCHEESSVVYHELVLHNYFILVPQSIQ